MRGQRHLQASAGQVVSNQTCGFASPAIQLTPSDVAGDPGQVGTMTFEAPLCELGQKTLHVTGEDCLGTQNLLQGSALAQAKLSVTGVRTELAFVEAIAPNGPDAARVELESVTLTEFSAFTVPAAGRLTVHSGTLSAHVQPTMGEELSKPGVFDVATPAASLSQVTLKNARVTLEAGSLRFDAVVTDLALDAVNGPWHGQTNSLRLHAQPEARLKQLARPMLKCRACVRA